MEMSMEEDEMEMSMEEDEYSFDSNTDAIIYGVSDPSGSDESMISGPNVSSSSSDDDISHQEQQQIQIPAAAAAAPVAGTGDDLTILSSRWITNDNTSNKQIEEEAAIMIFNVDFGALSRAAVHNEIMKIEERKNLNFCEQIKVPSPSFWEPREYDEAINWGLQDDEDFIELISSPLDDDPCDWLEQLLARNSEIVLNYTLYLHEVLSTS